MYRKLGKIIGAAAMTLSLTVSSWAQLNRGAIRGTASDPSGSPVPNASVTITNSDTNIAAPLITNGSGFYTAQDLVPGKYKVEFRASGFAHLVVNEVLIVAGTTATVDAALKVGDVRQSINVSDQAAVIDTSASNFTSSIGQG
jgi:Carboxypeptidase regulatory-like domain